MIAGRAGVDLSEDLFDVSTDPDDDPTPPSRGPMSPEMAAMVAKIEKRQANRSKGKKTIGASTFNRALSDVDEMIESGDWTEARPRHLVALYDRMHERVYGVEACELGPTERYNAMMMAANMVRNHFAGEVPRAIEYMRWAWTEELRKEKWCRENGRERHSRIGVRLMFSGALVTDYRLALARKGSRP